MRAKHRQGEIGYSIQNNSWVEDYAEGDTEIWRGEAMRHRRKGVREMMRSNMCESKSACMLMQRARGPAGNACKRVEGGRGRVPNSRVCFVTYMRHFFVFQKSSSDHSTRSDRLINNVARHLFVTLSPLSNCEKVPSRRGSGRQARSASLALMLSLNRK